MPYEENLAYVAQEAAQNVLVNIARIECCVMVNKLKALII